MTRSNFHPAFYRASSKARFEVKGACARWPLLVAALMLGGCVVVEGRCQAQVTPEQQEQRRREAKQGEQRVQFVEQFREQVKTDATGAMAAARAYFDAHPDLHDWNKIQLMSNVADALYFSGAPAEKKANGQTAIEVLQNGLRQFPTDERRLYLVQKLAQIQRAMGDVSGAEATMEVNWPVALRADQGRWSRELLETHLPMLQEQKRPDDVLQLRREVIEARPVEALYYWTREPGKQAKWWYKEGDLSALVKALSASGKREEALSWAKLGWQVSEFSDEGIGAATQLLSQAWMGQDLNLQPVRAFGAAQGRADAPNPLRAVALPRWDKGRLRAAIEKAPDETKVTLLIADGQLGAALEVAKGLIQRDPLGPQGAAGVRAVAQVFKAHDLNTLRANAFVAWMSDPATPGENPLTVLTRELAPATTPPPAR